MRHSSAPVSVHLAKGKCVELHPIANGLYRFFLCQCKKKDSYLCIYCPGDHLSISCSHRTVFSLFALLYPRIQWSLKRQWTQFGWYDRYWCFESCPIKVVKQALACNHTWNTAFSRFVKAAVFAKSLTKEDKPPEVWSLRLQDLERYCGTVCGCTHWPPGSWCINLQSWYRPRGYQFLHAASHRVFLYWYLRYQLRDEKKNNLEKTGSWQSEVQDRKDPTCD